MYSCIYEGHVAHRRRSPLNHQFNYRLYMAYLDLDELPDLIAHPSIISTRHYAPASFDRAVHLRDWDGPLDEAARNLVESRTGVRPLGPIRLLTQLRYFGHYFSPLNLYYCFDVDGENVDMVVAEVSNTPWGEQHCYVLWEGNRIAHDAGLQFSHPKSFHVSPFMDMDMNYQWRLTEPSSKLNVHLANIRNNETIFDASMSLSRHPLTRQRLSAMFVRYPMMTAQITAAIYWQALLLWWKKCPFYSHPKKSETVVSS